MNHAPRLAIQGGAPVRTKPMPARKAIGGVEREMIESVLDHYEALGLDPGYQGDFENRYCDAFCQHMGGGFADAVATGTVAVYLALKALQLPEGSDVLVSPITDPGTFSAIIESGLRPRLMDVAPGGYNVGPAEVEARLSKDVSAVLLVHATGKAAEVAGIKAIADKHAVHLIEDCSQAHGASHNGTKVGAFGSVAAFSTMYRKSSITGGSGGVVYTTDLETYRLGLAYADRGKPRWLENFNDRDPSSFLFPALNLHTDEISCAIGLASIARLDETRRSRLVYVQQVAERLSSNNSVCRAQWFEDSDSPFICPVFIDPSAIHVSVEEFAEAVRSEGINLNPKYMYLSRDWPWLEPYLADAEDTVMARRMRDESFCLYVNENYGPTEIADTVEAIMKVERWFGI